ncbi:homoserine kinase [Sphingomonas sp. ABOLD]|uniref:Homoserine kinase n=1 Tax=Sphingomonas trueperi TaxID=53317 RepID=A0A7X5XWD3_9SPHN|nr:MULTISPECIES: homoserine kinase [Sphingomonas]NJB96592.1 homoserine kinase type II [Sphingomonas trueperi]RSV40107.1 homoserine kinase [Sphingomonas sp. ABOLE]RSV46680.1 homoserine kinase [Sphingomonas sp. ABOLD]
MAVYTQVSAEALSAFLERFDVGELVSAKGIAEGVENSNYLVDTSKSRFILTLYEKRVDQGDLPYFMALLDHCADRGLPVPPAVPDRDGTLIHTLEGRPACLIQFLSGVSVSHPTPAQARAAAEAMGRMHKAVADFPQDRPNSMGVDTWRPLFERCGTSLNDIAPGLYEELGRALDRVTALWPREGFDTCAIHADLFPDNVLMLGNRVTGLIDFYFACTDLRLYDLAVMHTAWAFDATGERFDPYVSEALLEGYETSYKLTEKERAILPLLATGACIRFTLSRAWDWLNTPADALVTRKDPMAFWRRSHVYASVLSAIA